MTTAVVKVLRLNLLFLVLALAASISLAFAQDPTPPTSASGASSGSASSDAGAAAASAPAARATAAATMPGPYTSGTAPMPGDARTPHAWLPNGSESPDTGPSDVIFPVQQITIRFNHKLHVQQQNLQCKNCHSGALTSESAQDSLIPKPQLCDSCHNSDHSNPAQVQAGDDAMGKCAFCHVGYKPEAGNTVARLAIPRPNLLFNHKKHAARNIGCQQCHGEVQNLELATRDQMPRMAGCFRCHQMSDAAARGTAKSNCENCHVRATGGEAGRIKTSFVQGTLMPPRWLHNAAHTPDWIERHKMVAATDSEFCGNCHKEDFCTNCHDGRVRPRNIHPNDYISMHPIEARQATQRCTSCHREQSFCLTCHQRLGISMTGPADIKASARFHPPKEIWSNAPRQPGHHSFEAERNLNACVSCHTERDCVVCHGGQGIGGGFDPHKSGFAGGCASQMRRNPRPCFVCHQPSDGVLAQCR